MQTDNEIYADYLRAQGLDDEQIRDRIAMEDSMAGKPEAETSLAGDIGRGAMKVLDYGSNLGRGALFGSVQAGSHALANMGAIDKPLNMGVNFNDVIKGNTPTSDELMRRGEVPAMDLFPNNAYIPSGRTLLGLAGDIALDPTTYIPVVGQASMAEKLAARASKYAPRAGEVLNTAQKAVNAVQPGELLAKGGRALWKSGFKNLDAELMHYGKDPVSDILIREGVTGTRDQVYKQMDEIGERLLAERDAILREAKVAGAEVDMNEAMAPALKYIEELKRTGDPEVMPLIEKYEAQVQQYLNQGAREAELVPRTLPRQGQYAGQRTEILGYDQGGKTIPEVTSLPIGGEFAPTYRQVGDLPVGQVQPLDSIANIKKNVNPKAKKQGGFGVSDGDPIDVEMGQLKGGDFVLNPEVRLPGTGKQFTEPQWNAGKVLREEYLGPNKPELYDEFIDRIAGPNPVQTTAWKSRGQQKVGDEAYNIAASTPQGQRLQVEINKGLKNSTENSVDSVLPMTSENPVFKGDVLRQKNDELGRILSSKEKALNDAIAAEKKDLFTSVDGLAVINPQMLAAKKTADFAKSGWFKTKAGKAMKKAGDKTPESVWRQILLTPDERNGLED